MTKILTKLPNPIRKNPGFKAAFHNDTLSQVLGSVVIL